MKRKDFLQASGLFAAAGLLPVPALAMPGEEEAAVRQPPFLKAGSVIAITSPAGTISPEELLPAIQVLRGWGYEVRVGATVGKKDFSFGGTDAERLADLQALLDDPKVDAILSARGGYGSVRIVDRIDWTGFRKYPKWLIGFSDITVLHSHIHRHTRIATVHSKMCNSFPDDWEKAEPVQVETILSIRDVLEGRRVAYAITPNPQNRLGKCTGPLVGGNLKTLETLAGTASDIKTDGRILFLEDTGEYLYSIDRMFWNLQRSGKLKNLKGLIIGGFKVKPDDPGEEFGRTVADIIMEKIKDHRYPVCFDFPVGHQRANFALKCGVPHTLQVQADTVSLVEGSR